MVSGVNIITKDVFGKSIIHKQITTNLILFYNGIKFIETYPAFFCNSWRWKLRLGMGLCHWRLHNPHPCLLNLPRLRPSPGWEEDLVWGVIDKREGNCPAMGPKSRETTIRHARLRKPQTIAQVPSRWFRWKQDQWTFEYRRLNDDIIIVKILKLLGLFNH